MDNPVNMQSVYLTIVLAPLLGSLAAGLFGWKIGRAGAHWATILGVAISFLLSLIVFKHLVMDGALPFDGTIYTWLVSGGGLRLEVGFRVDELTAVMLVVVTFVSLMVHIYTIGYMHEDPGYTRFFSYIALFTFAMLMLVMANNFLQLFFGWEGVGVVSYLLIGFWFKRESAIYASLKAFLVNRVGDFGFVLGIAAIYRYCGALDYTTVFQKIPALAGQTLSLWPGNEWSVITLICILLFIGAMSKSAQVPLHVWLPDSMEGPTPISALIHAATMVTAGIFMVARMSPIFEYSETALSVVLVIGSITAFFMGLLGLVQNDIKRVVAYSTLSQLGYMTVALGASAYAAGVFHLMTHAFFKALLFLGAGSVIIAMHHDQDIRHMGGLRKYMPITYWTGLIGSLALIGFPGFSGFFSKDAIISAVEASQLPGAGVAYVAVLSGVFVTALYSFRMFFLVFHGQERMDHHTREHLHETPPVVTVPLIALAIPSMIVGAFFVGPMLFEHPGFFGHSIFVLPQHDVLGEMAHHWHGPLAFVVHSLSSPVLWLAMAGLGTAYLFYMVWPNLPDLVLAQTGLFYQVLMEKYGFDRFYDSFFAGGGRRFGRFLWQVGDVTLIDGVMVNGTAKAVGWISSIVRYIQSGFLYHYAFAMILGLLFLLGWFLVA
ncbi:NADH-quinone oxidoreductase subunit L [Gammaproteobacteria bacterium]